MSDQEILETAKRRWRQVFDTESRQRAREEEDLGYQLADNQWSAAAKQERAGNQGEGIPPRPMLSVSLLHQPKQLVQNQVADAQLGVNVRPVGENSSKEWAEIREDLYRRIERDSNADVARLWALDRALQCGRGWYRINTKWDEESENNWDQEIVIQRLLYQEMVYMDPAAQETDFSDARWGFLAAWVPLETFRELYPKAAVSDADFAGLVEHEPDWVRGSADERVILVAEQFYKERVVREVIEHPKQKGRKRELVDIAVKWCKLTGVEVLEKEDWAGHHIPLVPVFGKELQPIKGERHWVGMIRDGGARDAQQFFNYSISTAVERMALEPRAPFIGYKEQFEGNEKYWDTANRRNWPYLPSNMLTADGKVLPLPQRSQVDQTGTSLAMMGVELARTLVQSATAIYDPGLGKESDREKSGRAILALQQQGDAGSSNYAWNMTHVSYPCEARIVLDLMPAIYDRPGRITTVLGGEDDIKTVMLGRPFVLDPSTGRPQPAQQGAPGAQFYDLRQGRYAVSVSIGRSFQTRLQEGQEALSQLVPNLPPEAQIILLPTFLRFQDSPGSKEASDLLKKYRDMKFPGLADDKDQPMSAEQAQAKVAAQEAQLREMQQALQGLIQKLETEEAKQRAALEKAQLDATTKLQLEQMEQRHAAMLEQMRLQAEAIQKALDRAHETREHREEMAHEVAMAAAGGKTATFSREDGQEEGREDENESSQGRSQASAPEAE